MMNCSKMSRILSFGRKPSGQGLQSIYSESLSVDSITSRSQSRYIPPRAENTLDAPNIVDDSHLNLVDWSESNILSIALGNAVYLWDPVRFATSELLTADEEDGPISSVNWAGDGEHIAVGLSSCTVQIWDSASNRQLRSLKGHRGRVGSLSWNENQNVLASGGEDSSIIIHDVRIRNSNVKTYRGHEGEVCGLKWSLSGQKLASGGSDNLLHIWDNSMSSCNDVRKQYLHRMNEHYDAVTALTWCPFQHNLLASGGDESIKFWNSGNGTCLNTIDTNSSVSALLWSKHERELLSAHGYSENQLTLWKYPSMAKITELTGHTDRVLDLTQSPDGYSVASAGADEILRIWKAFGTPDTSKKTKTKEPQGLLNPLLMRIR